MCSRWESTWNPEKWNETTSQTGTSLHGLLKNIFNKLKGICYSSRVNPADLH